MGVPEIGVQVWTEPNQSKKIEKLAALFGETINQKKESVKEKILQKERNDRKKDIQEKVKEYEKERRLEKETTDNLRSNVTERKLKEKGTEKNKTEKVGDTAPVEQKSTFLKKTNKHFEMENYATIFKKQSITDKHSYRSSKSKPIFREVQTDSEEKTCTIC